MQNSRIAEETYIFFSDAHKVLPGEPSINTVKRWTRRGMAGTGDGIFHRLEWCRMAGRSATSMQAYHRWLRRINGEAPPTAEDVERSRQADQSFKEKW